MIVDRADSLYSSLESAWTFQSSLASVLDVLFARAASFVSLWTRRAFADVVEVDCGMEQSPCEYS